MVENNFMDELTVICPDDCGNAPKKRIIRDFKIAYAQQDLPHMLELLADNMKWHIVGGPTIQGKANVTDAIPANKPTALHFSHLISHGKICAAHGILTYANQQVSFCDIFVFNSFGKQGKIAEITSYLIPTS